MTSRCARSRLAAWCSARRCSRGLSFSLPTRLALVAIEPADGEHQVSSTTTTQPGSEEESAGINQLPPFNTVVGGVLSALAVSVLGRVASVAFGVYINRKLAEQSKPRRQRRIPAPAGTILKMHSPDIEQTRRIPLQPTANRRDECLGCDASSS